MSPHKGAILSAGLSQQYIQVPMHIPQQPPKPLPLDIACAHADKKSNGAFVATSSLDHVLYAPYQQLAKFLQCLPFYFIFVYLTDFFFLIAMILFSFSHFFISPIVFRQLFF